MWALAAGQGITSLRGVRSLHRRARQARGGLRLAGDKVGDGSSRLLSFGQGGQSGGVRPGSLGTRNRSATAPKGRPSCSATRAGRRMAVRRWSIAAIRDHAASRFHAVVPKPRVRRPLSRRVVGPQRGGGPVRGATWRGVSGGKPRCTFSRGRRPLRWRRADSLRPGGRRCPVVPQGCGREADEQNRPCR